MRAFRPIAPGWLAGLGVAIVIIGAVVLWLILRPSPTGPQGTPGVNGSPGPSTVVTPPPSLASPSVLVIPPGQTTKVTTTPTTRPTTTPSSHVTSTPRPTPRPTRTPPPSPSPTPRPSLICVLGHCPI